MYLVCKRCIQQPKDDDNAPLFELERWLAGYPMLCDFCVQTPEITAFYHMVGNFNVLLRFAVPDVKTLDALVGRIKTFGDSRTSIEL
mgnify:CR=1 FL=1